MYIGMFKFSPKKAELFQILKKSEKILMSVCGILEKFQFLTSITTEYRIPHLKSVFSIFK